MGMDDTRLPGLYPISFHIAARDAVRIGGWRMLDMYDSEMLAKRNARRWRAFVKSLREYPGHATSRVVGNAEFESCMTGCMVKVRVCTARADGQAALATAEKFLAKSR